MIDTSYKRDTTPTEQSIHCCNRPEFQVLPCHNNLSCHLFVKPISHYVADEPWSSLVLCLFWYQLLRHGTSCDWLPLVATQIYHSWVTVSTPRKQANCIHHLRDVHNHHPTFHGGKTQILPFINFTTMTRCRRLVKCLLASSHWKLGNKNYIRLTSWNWYRLKDEFRSLQRSRRGSKHSSRARTNEWAASLQGDEASHLHIAAPFHLGMLCYAVPC